MFGRGRFANRPYNVLTSQGFPFQLRNFYAIRIGLTRLDSVSWGSTPHPAIELRPLDPVLAKRAQAFQNNGSVA